MVIDPRRTETAEQADLHVPVLPDGDMALLNTLLGEMVRRGLAGGGTAESNHGIDNGTFQQLADLVAAHPRMVTVFSMGANQSVAGTDKGNAAAVLREYAAMTALSVEHGKVCDLTEKAGASDPEYEAMAPFLWGGRYPLAAHAMRIVPVEARARTGLAPTPSQHRREPLLEVHPEHAAAAGATDDALARVVTASGASVFRVNITDGQARGQVFVPMHRTGAMASGGRGNLLADQSVDPLSGQPGFKNNTCRIEPVTSE